MVDCELSSVAKEVAAPVNDDDSLLESASSSNVKGSSSTKKTLLHNEYNRKFVIARGNIKEKKLYRLRHPRFATATLYAINSNSVEEVLRFEDPHRSFFYGESVVSDGCITIMCMIHPLFLAIPYLLKNAKECYASIEDILVDEEFPAIVLLMHNEKLLETLKLVYISGTRFWRHNEEMLLRWLEGRFEKLKNSLVKNACLHNAVIENDDALRRHTYSLLSDYTPQVLNVALKEYLKIKDLEVHEVQPLKRRLENCQESCYNAAENVKQKKSRLSAMQKKLQVASKGTKSITGFFKNEK